MPLAKADFEATGHLVHEGVATVGTLNFAAPAVTQSRVVTDESFGGRIICIRCEAPIIYNDKTTLIENRDFGLPILSQRGA